MGKSRRNRSHAGHRRNPIAKPIKPPSDPELAALRESKILPILQDLQSADPKSRSSAASAVSSIIQDTKCRKLLLREQIVHIVLTQTVTDSALESRAAGWGILQVLAQEEDVDFCIHLYRLDAVTAIEHAARLTSQAISSQEQDFQKRATAEKAFLFSIASSLVSLLTALAESQDEVPEAISQRDSITQMLFTLATYQSKEDDGFDSLRSDTLECLMVLCEDNEALSQKIIEVSTCLETLTTLKDTATGEGILSCGILHNIFASLIGSKTKVEDPDANDSILIPTLSKAVASITPEQPTANGAGWSSPFEYQQLALEILASIGTGIHASNAAPSKPTREDRNGAKDDEDIEGVDDAEDMIGSDQEAGEEDEDDEMDEDEMEADMDMVTGADDNEDEGDIDELPTLKQLFQLAMPELIRVASMQPSDENSMSLQGHALSALNNIAWSVSVFDLADESNAGIKKTWQPIGTAIWKTVISPILASDTADINLASQVTSLAWAVARTLQGNNPLGSDEHRKFMTLYNATKGSVATASAQDDPGDPFQSLGVKCIGVLGQLALHPAAVDLNREIGTFLVTQVAALPNTPVADAVEALNQLFDVYGDEDYAYDSEVFWKDNFIKHMEDALPKVRVMMKTVDRKAFPELRTRADEVVINLTRFLSYKRKHRPS